MQMNLFLSVVTFVFVNFAPASVVSASDEQNSQAETAAQDVPQFDPNNLDSILDFHYRVAGLKGFQQARDRFLKRAHAALKYAESHPNSKESKRALTFICKTPVYSETSVKAAELYAKWHAMESDTAELLSFLFSDEALRQIEKNHPDKRTRYIAKFVLADNLLQRTPMWRGWSEKDLPTLRTIEKQMIEIRDNCGSCEFRQMELQEMVDDFLNRAQSLIPGCQMDEITGTSLAGKPLVLSDYQDKVVLLYCWASWSSHCVEQLPQHRRIVEKYRDKPFVFLGINADVTQSSAQKLIDSGDVTWTSFWLGENPIKHPTRIKLRIQAWPTIYLLDQNGIIRYVNPSDKQIEKAIDGLLDQMKRNDS